MVIVTESPHLSLHETVGLRKLRQELQNDAVAYRFVSDFLDLLDERLADIDRSMAAGERERAITALLTIETSSEMIGAHQLKAAAVDVRRAIGSVEPIDELGLLAHLHLAGATTKRMFGRR